MLEWQWDMFGVAIFIIWVIERYDIVAMGHVWSGNIYNMGDRKI